MLILSSVAMMALFGVTSAEAARFNLTLDDGTTAVVVDNFSTRSNVHVSNLVVAADRSTQDDGMWYRARKGLMASGHRVYVNDNYIAWLNNGVLQGVWTLDASTGLFAHNRTGPNGYYPWAHNELIKGSASPQQQLFVWDWASPGIEHSIGFQSGPIILLGTHNGGYFAPNGNWHVIYDGAIIGGEVYYATGGRLAGKAGPGPYQVDVSDGDDSNGIQNYIDSQLGFIMRQNDIKVVWRFAPALAPVAPFHTYYWIWANYSFDIDGTVCDQSPATNDSPNQVWGEPGYFQSNLPSSDTSTGYPAWTITALARGTVCSLPHPIRSISAPADGDWIRWGESSLLPAGSPRWTLTHKVDSSWGTPINWNYLSFGNEVIDGVWGGGGVIYSPVFAQGVWYTTTYLLSTQ